LSQVVNTNLRRCPILDLSFQHTTTTIYYEPIWQNQLQANNPVVIGAACSNAGTTLNTVGGTERRRRNIRSKHRSGQATSV